MGDLLERKLERKAACGDDEAAEALRQLACRRGEHKWASWIGPCTVCKIGRHDYYAGKARDRQCRKEAAQRIRCAGGVHEWVPGDKLPEDCGCWEIHRCYLRVCEGCGIPEEL